MTFITLTFGKAHVKTAFSTKKNSGQDLVGWLCWAGSQWPISTSVFTLFWLPFTAPFFQKTAIKAHCNSVEFYPTRMAPSSELQRRDKSGDTHHLCNRGSNFCCKRNPAFCPILEPFLSPVWHKGSKRLLPVIPYSVVDKLYYWGIRDVFSIFKKICLGIKGF